MPKVYCPNCLGNVHDVRAFWYCCVCDLTIFIGPAPTDTVFQDGLERAYKAEKEKKK